MTPFEIGLLALAAMGFLVLIGLYVPITLIACSFVGVWAIKGSPLLASKMLGLAANDAISSYFFGVVPLFVLMGFVVSESGMGRDAFDVANAMLRRIKGDWGLGPSPPTRSLRPLPVSRSRPPPFSRKSPYPNCAAMGILHVFRSVWWPDHRFWGC